MKIKIIAALTACGLMFSASATAAGVIIHEKKTTTVITRGVTHITTQRYTTAGWYTIHTLRIDLNQDNFRLKTLTSTSGVNFRETVPVLAQQHNALAAVNADFFQPSGSDSRRASAIGVVVDEGRMLTTPARGKDMATAAVTNDGTVVMGLWDQYINVIAPNGNKHQVYHYNKYYDQGALVIYNSDWDSASPGYPLTQTEMVVEDGIVTDIRTAGGKPITFPENSYVVASTDGKNKFITDNFRVGDAVVIDSWLEPKPEDYMMAVGGGTMLITNGQNAPVTHNISGTNPRSAMGVDQSGKIAYLVTVDGRMESSLGMTLNELRDYMRSLGCHNAINFDGGGSTTIVTKELYEDGSSLKNTPSDGSLRRVTNAVGIVSTAPYGDPANLYIFCDDTRFCVDWSYPLKVDVLDENYQKLAFDESLLTFEVQGVEGYFDGNIFNPLSSGKAKVIARYDGLEGHFDIYVRPRHDTPEADSMRLDAGEESEGTKIVLIGNTNYSNLLGKLYAERAVRLANSEADAVVFLDATKPSITANAVYPAIYGEYYYAAYKHDTLIIQLNNKVNGLFKSDDLQWGRFIDQLNDVNAKNVVITLSQPPNSEGFKSSLELKLFKELLETKLVEKGKNVFVVYDNDKNSMTIENSIRYFGLKGIKGVSSSSYTSLSDCTYLVITSNDDEVKYKIKNILEV